jgi:hypothetical protein
MFVSIERLIPANPVLLGQTSRTISTENIRNVISVGYMPSVTEFVTGYKCQDCGWSETDR